MTYHIGSEQPVELEQAARAVALARFEVDRRFFAQPLSRQELTDHLTQMWAWFYQDRFGLLPDRPQLRFIETARKAYEDAQRCAAEKEMHYASVGTVRPAEPSGEGIPARGPTSA